MRYFRFGAMLGVCEGVHGSDPVESRNARSHPMSRSAQDLRRQSRSRARAESRDPDRRVLRAARAERGGEDNDHRDSGRLAGADFGRGFDSRAHSWRENAREMREWLGISLQETRLSEKLTVRETVELFASFYREPRYSDEVLEQLQLTEKADAWVGKLSGGQRQRLAVATALVCNPKILFLDEPTTGLDPQSRRQLWDIIREFQRAGGTVLLTTHYMDEAERLCDRLAIVDHGQIIAEGSPADLIERLGGHHVVEFAVEAKAGGNSDGAALEAWRALAERGVGARG